MSRLLVIDGTTNGHTGKVARALGDALRAQGHDAEVVDATDAVVEPQDYAGIIVAASVHAGGYQKSVRRWVCTHADALRERPNAFVSVCLGVLQKDPAVDEHLRTILDDFVAATRWRPATTKIIAGALLYTRYDPLTRWVMKRIARKAGGDTDTSRDYEYTDWNDLRAFAQQFRQCVKSRTRPLPGADDSREIAGRPSCRRTS